MNIDDRGSFTEFLKTKEYSQVSVNISKQGITKGNYWHHTKNEKSIKELPLKYGEWGRIKIKLRISLERCHRIIKNLGLYSYCCKKSEYDE